MNLNAVSRTRRGPSRFSVRKAPVIAVAIMCLCLVLGGCKATSTLTVTLGDKASGTVTMQLVLDKQAASTLRSDSYDTTTLSKIFDTAELKKAGFHVDVKDVAAGQSHIDLSASFSNEKQLRAALAVLAPPSVVDATLTSHATILNNKQSASIVIDVSRLRDLYLKNADVKQALQKAGIEFSEFDKLVNSAMKSTTFTVVLKQSGRQDKATVTGSTKKPETVALSRNVFRTRYLTNMAGAILAGLVALFLLWRLCRTPRLLSKNTRASASSKNASDASKKFR